MVIVYTCDGYDFGEEDVDLVDPTFTYFVIVQDKMPLSETASLSSVRRISPLPLEAESCKAQKCHLADLKVEKKKTVSDMHPPLALPGNFVNF
jgi:hypothetical protein